MATDTPTKTELPDDATHEQVEEVVDKIMKDRVADEPPEETSDAEKVGSGKAVTQRDTEDTADGENRTLSGSDSETTGDGADAKSDDDSDWRDDANAEAAAYGIGKDEIAEFTSREELDRALKLFDRQVDAERKKVLDGSESEEEEQGKPAKGKSKEKGETSEPEDGRADSSAYEIRLDKDAYDEELVGEFTQMRDHYESRIAAIDERFTAIEERFTNADAVAAEERFDRSVDDLEFSKLFGTTGKESADELKRRKDLYDRVQIEQIVMSRMGRDVGDHTALVRRVARSIFPEDYDKRLISNRTRKVSRMSDKRQGGGATRPTDPPETLREEMRQLYGELDHQSG